MVDEGEIIKRNARLRDKNEPFIGDIKQCISKKSSLSIAHAHFSPFRDLQREDTEDITISSKFWEILYSKLCAKVNRISR